jgi:hypothetical protein
MLCKAKFAVCSEIHTKKHKFHVITTLNFLMLNIVVLKLPVGFERLNVSGDLNWRFRQRVWFSVKGASIQVNENKLQNVSQLF